jgi:CDP-paratose 2-epimerase
MRILVTGSSGLIGGEIVEYFGSQGHSIVGIDNNLRREFFGEAGNTLWNLHRVANKVKDYKHHEADIRDRAAINGIFKQDGPFDAVIHCAAQPSHDKSRDIPMTDFEVNAFGTAVMLEVVRQLSPQSVFIFMSTNKVYGDAPNEKLLVELPTRFDFAKQEDKNGIGESCRVDQSTHSIFGASKVAADILVQEYGRYYGLRTTVFRGGCLTGPGHSGVELHGFLSYLVKVAITGAPYKVYGYKGKQVRDNIHSYDVIRAMEEVIKNPRQGEVYNIGGGRENSISMIEAIQKIEALTGKKINWEYIEQNRIGDHICYITDLSKFKSHYPDWSITKSIDTTLTEMIQQDYWGKYSDHEQTKTYPLLSSSLVLDVGGYRGAWTASILEKYNPRVYVFEPVGEFYEACVKRFEGRPNVTVYGFGLSDTNRDTVFSKQGQNTSEYRGGENQEQLPEDRVYGRPTPESVHLRDIDEICRENGFSEIDLISINAEGGEYDLLRRMIETGLVSHCKNIQIQFHRFHPDAERLRNEIRTELAKTHVESFDYPFVWESWARK